MSEELKPCPHCGETKYLKLTPYRADDDGGEPFDWGFTVLCSALGFEHRPRGCGSNGAWGETQEEAIAAWNRRPSPPVVEGEPGKLTCERCGGPVRVWFAPNKLWNLVKGGPAATDDPGGMLCPNCFIDAAEEAGLNPTAWVLDVEHLQTSEPELERLRALIYDEPILSVRAFVAGHSEFKVKEVLSEHDRFARKTIFNCLTYLSRRGEIERLGYGLYRRSKSPRSEGDK